jgi:tRNA(fMet)-specific endonuclease VapC
MAEPALNRDIREAKLFGNNRSQAVRSPQGWVFDQIAALGSAAICISIVTATDLCHGCAKKGSPRLPAQVEAFS